MPSLPLSRHGGRGGSVLFRTAEFKADLRNVIHGKEHVIPAVHGIWSSFCKTVYASNPQYGGWENFQRTDLSVLAVLEHMQQIGFTVSVDDEGDFWQSRDLVELARAVGHQDALLAGAAGLIKDAAKASGEGIDPAIPHEPNVRPQADRNFKIDSLTGHLAKSRAALVA